MSKSENSRSENPLLPDDDPIMELLDKPFQSLSDKELDDYVTKLHQVNNNPQALNRALNSKNKKVKTKSKSTAVEDAAFEQMMASL